MLQNGTPVSKRLCNKTKDPAERSIFLAFFSPFFRHFFNKNALCCPSLFAHLRIVWKYQEFPLVQYVLRAFCCNLRTFLIMQKSTKLSTTLLLTLWISFCGSRLRISEKLNLSCRFPLLWNFINYTIQEI